MLRTIREKRLLWPAVATLAGVALLISLGNWQMQRAELEAGADRLHRRARARRRR